MHSFTDVTDTDLYTNLKSWEGDIFVVFVIARFFKGLKYCYERACGIFKEGSVSLQNQIEINWRYFFRFGISKRSCFYTVLKILLLSVIRFNNVRRSVIRNP